MEIVIPTTFTEALDVEQGPQGILQDHSSGSNARLQYKCISKYDFRFISMRMKTVKRRYTMGKKIQEEVRWESRKHEFPTISMRTVSNVPQLASVCRRH